jgi:ubiquinone/menaquinone biosynthesis C-methylase UbiE
MEYLFLIGLIFALYFVCMWMKGHEGFENGEQVDPYDSVYAEIYKTLWYPQDLIEYEQVSIQDIALSGWAVDSVHVLDIACGISPHACWFKQMGVDFIGADNSADMLKQAELDCPTAKFKKTDVIQASAFRPKQFTHCLLLGFAIYELPQKTLFDNAYAWTQPGGFLVVHMVDPDKYDPILNLASPFAAFSLQKYSYDRQTKSEIYFTNFKYIGDLHKKKDHDDAEFKETIVYFYPKNGVKYREQTREWTMPSVERLIELAKTSGFKLEEKVHLVSASKEYQYLVYFKK